MLRGMLYDRSLNVWDAHYATHGAYENTFGDEGAIRLMLYEDSLEYNVMDFRDEQDNYRPHTEVRAWFLANPVMQRIYGAGLETIDISGNEI